MADPAAGGVSDTSPLGEQRDVEAWRSAAAGEPPVHPAPRRDNRLVASLKDAAVVALIAGALGFFFLGLRTEIGVGTLEMRTRWGTLITAILIVFGGRLILNLLFFTADRAPGRSFSPFKISAEMLGKAGRIIGPIFLLIALVLPFLLLELAGVRARQYIDLSILILTYIMLGGGLNIVVGLAGLLDLGYVAFYAVGA